jgi:acetyltransferase-like isoleucine patch superfamily enzyme
MTNLLESLMAFWNRKILRKRTPKFYRGQEKFRERYPEFTVGIGTYGMPIVHDWHEGSTLRIGAYTSIADEVHIFLGGHHRTDWISAYPFPAFMERQKTFRASAAPVET